MLALAALAAAAPLARAADEPRSRPRGQVHATVEMVGPVDPTAAAMAQELTRVREGATPADWLASAPDERLTPFAHDVRARGAGAWCMRASRRTRLPDGHEVERHAYFYPPSPPVPAVLPPGGVDRSLALKECRLGLLWVETKEPNSRRGDALVRALAQVLAVTYRPTAMNQPVYFPGAGDWVLTSRWQVGPRTIVSAYDHKGEERRVLAFVLLPESGQSVDLNSGPDVEDTSLDVDIVAEARRALAIAGREPARSAPLLALLDAARAYTGPGGAEPFTPDALAQALQQWLADAATLAPRRRAAVLFVADAVLSAVSRAQTLVGGAEHADLRRRLHALGADFEQAPIGGEWVYTRGWLREAQRLDPAGPIGELAFVHLMETAFDTSPGCPGGEDGFRRVITEGEAYLRRASHGRARAIVELFVADAYRDIVTLATGGSGYAAPAKYAAEAPVARRRALEHYRAGLGLDDASARARSAWREAWRLLADLPPMDTRFFCIYD